MCNSIEYFLWKRFIALRHQILKDIYTYDCKINTNLTLKFSFRFSNIPCLTHLLNN